MLSRRWASTVSSPAISSISQGRRPVGFGRRWFDRGHGRFPKSSAPARRWDWDALLEAGGDDLDDVASGEADPLAGESERAPIGFTSSLGF